MDQVTYINAIVKRLHCSNRKKADIRKELRSNIELALDNGESWEKVRKDMGAPADIAAEFNENFPQSERNAAKRRKRMQVAGVIVLALVVIVIAVYWMLPRSSVIHGTTFDEKTVIRQAEQIIEMINSNDYEGIRNQSNGSVKTVLTDQTISVAKEKLGSNLGNFKSYSSSYTCQIVQKGKKYAVAEITALYENRSVTYTITFDQGMMVAGLYMK